MNTDFELCCWQRYWCCWRRVCGVCPLSEVSCRRMGAVVMIFEVSICWCSTAVTAVGCSDALEPGGSRGVVFLPLWAVRVGYHSLSAEGVGVLARRADTNQPLRCLRAVGHPSPPNSVHVAYGCWG